GTDRRPLGIDSPATGFGYRDPDRHLRSHSAFSCGPSVALYVRHGGIIADQHLAHVALCHERLSKAEGDHAFRSGSGLSGCRMEYHSVENRHRFGRRSRQGLVERYLVAIGFPAGKPYGFYYCGAGGRFRPGWRIDIAGFISWVDCAGLVYRGECTEDVQSFAGGECYPDVFCLCLCYYRHGDWPAARGGSSVTHD